MNTCGWKAPLEINYSLPLLKARSGRAACLGPHSVRFWMSTASLSGCFSGQLVSVRGKEKKAKLIFICWSAVSQISVCVCCLLTLTQNFYSECNYMVMICFDLQCLKWSFKKCICNCIKEAIKNYSVLKQGKSDNLFWVQENTFKSDRHFICSLVLIAQCFVATQHFCHYIWLASGKYAKNTCSIDRISVVVCRKIFLIVLKLSRLLCFKVGA